MENLKKFFKFYIHKEKKYQPVETSKEEHPTVSKKLKQIVQCVGNSAESLGEINQMLKNMNEKLERINKLLENSHRT
jgi:methyl-accepting chemotaxis protein